jgi:hypothetical protein
VDATADGIPILWVGVLRVSVKVVITVVGIDTEDREAGAAIRAAKAQQQRPRHSRGARTSSPPCNRKRKPRKDDAKAASDLADAEAVCAEEAAMREAIAKSLADLIPIENSMPMDAALAWSRQDWEREQAEQHRQLLDLAQV